MSQIAATRQLQCADKQRAALYRSTKTSRTPATARRVNTGGLLSCKQSQKQCKGTRQTWRRRVDFTHCIWGQSLRFLVHREDEQWTTPLCKLHMSWQLLGISLINCLMLNCSILTCLMAWALIWLADTYYYFLFFCNESMSALLDPPPFSFFNILPPDRKNVSSFQKSI